jgi:hypothetical protein
MANNERRIMKKALSRTIALLVVLCVSAVLDSRSAAANSEAEYEAMSLDMRALNGQEKYQELIETYEPYAKPANLNFGFYIELGLAYFHREILQRNVKQNPEWNKVERYLSIAHQIRPDNLYVIIHLAILHTYTGDHRKAHFFAKTYLDKGGKERKKDAETILEKYKYTITEERRPGPVPGAEGPAGPLEPKSQ